MTDADADGYEDIAAGGDDRDDGDPAVNPGATDTCDGEDDDRDQEIDEDGALIWYADVTPTSCVVPEGYVSNTEDCDGCELPGDPGDGPERRPRRLRDRPGRHRRRRALLRGLVRHELRWWRLDAAPARRLGRDGARGADDQLRRLVRPHPAPDEGQAFQGAGRHWQSLNGWQDHMIVHHVRGTADDGTTCDPLYDIGASGEFTINESVAYLSGLQMSVSLTSSPQPSTSDSGPAAACVHTNGGVPGFYRGCCSICPTCGDSDWGDERHPMANDPHDTPDALGATTAETGPGGYALRSNKDQQFMGIQVMEDDVR